MYPGRTAEEKPKTRYSITGCFTDIAKCEDKFVSVAVEETTPEAWAEEVCRPDILEKEETRLQPFRPAKQAHLSQSACLVLTVLIQQLSRLYDILNAWAGFRGKSSKRRFSG